MASISRYVAYDIAFKLNATAGTVTRTSATKYTVKIDASWSCYYSNNATYCGVTASSGGNSLVLNPNQTKASSGSGSFTGTYSISGNSAATKSIVVTFTIYDPTTGSTASKSTTITLNVSVPAWTSYTIKYNANGGSGAPSSQTKWKDQTLTLSSTKPTRTGYTFLGWSTSSSATSATYSASGSYTANAATTLYAVWKIITYTIKFNANGGSGAPSSQTKSYGVTLTLPTTKPTRTNYNFLGWATSSTATSAKYLAGGSYTANTAATLYAVWELAYTKPRITGISVSRCDSNGAADDEGQNGLVSFNFDCDKELTTITIAYKLSTSSSWTSETIYTYLYFTNSTGGTSGSVTKERIGSNSLSAENTYDIRITVTDSGGSTAVTVSLPSTKFAIDVKSGGTGVAFGKVAETDDLADFAYQTRFGGGILQPVLASGTDMDSVLTPNVYTGKNASSSSYTNLPFTSGTFTLKVESSGPDGQLMQTVTLCSKTESRTWERLYYSSAWGDWKCITDFANKLLWSGVKYMSEEHTITLSETVRSQTTGICLTFSRYADGEAKDYGWVTYFVPKKWIGLHNGTGHNIVMSNSTADFFATKYLYIYDDKIVGHADNMATGTAVSGIKYANNNYVLREVIGV